jgi:hypothetical protein
MNKLPDDHETVIMHQSMARALDEFLNGEKKEGRAKKYGFVLLTFEFGHTDNGLVNYVSNANREDMLTAMREWIARAEGRVLEPTKERQ